MSTDKEWMDYLRKVCAGSDHLDLEPCPYCGKREYLRAGHESAMAFAVECMNCRCVGPVWSYRRVTGSDEYLLPEIQEEVDKRKKEGVSADIQSLLERTDPLNYLDAFLLEMAIKDWNTRDGERDIGT